MLLFGSTAADAVTGLAVIAAVASSLSSDRIDSECAPRRSYEAKLLPPALLRLTMLLLSSSSSSLLTGRWFCYCFVDSNWPYY